jgi:hypothetical protein
MRRTDFTWSLTDQIGLGHLYTSKHEMFCFEKTVFKTFELLLESRALEQTSIRQQ